MRLLNIVSRPGGATGGEAEAWERGEAEAADEAPAAAAELAVPESFAAQWRRLRGEESAA
jgi:hypothetical protein